jgi:hypothetical protein
MKNPIQFTNRIDPARGTLNGSRSRHAVRLLLVAGFSLIALGVSSTAWAVCREGCLTDENTVLGEEALVNNTIGINNTALGWFALYYNTTGESNTAVGANALWNDTTGFANTAVGSSALSANTTGINNTAVGGFALPSNSTGSGNTAIGSGSLSQNWESNNNTACGYLAIGSPIGTNNTATGALALRGVVEDDTNPTAHDNTADGAFALQNITSGSFNVASGVSALYSNNSGSFNTASGASALFANTSGVFNTADGAIALASNTTGNNNTALGKSALTLNNSGLNNTACGWQALLRNTTGSSNIGLGDNAGSNLTTGSNNIDIGNLGVADETGTIRIGTTGTHLNTYIAGIFKIAVKGVPVFIGADGHLGTGASSVRFKEAIKPMNEASEAIHALQPVTFRYKQELDPDGTAQFGLIAEEVAKVNPDLVVRDEEGKPYTVRYEAVNAMLLNEFLKEHRKGREQDEAIAQLESAVVKHEATIAQQKDFRSIIARQQKEIEALTASLKEQASQIQKVSELFAPANPSIGGLEARKSSPQLVVNNQ